MKKVRLIILTDEEVEQSKIQKLLDQEIEEQGILIGWKAANVTSQLSNLKNQIIIKYKNSKVMRFEKGNLLLCNKDGCYTPVKKDMEICDFYNKGGGSFSFMQIKDYLYITSMFWLSD